MSGGPERDSGWAHRLIGNGLRSSSAPTPVVELVAALLRTATADQARTSADLKTAELSVVLDALEDKLGTILLSVSAGRGRSETISTAVLSQVISVLDDFTQDSRIAPGAPALVAATVVDEHLGKTFIDHFSSVQSPLRPGDPYPVIPFPSDQLDIADADAVIAALKNRTGAPGNRTPWDDRVARLRLAPPDITRLRVDLVWADPWLEPVTASTTFGVCVTNLDIEPEFDWDEYLVGTRPMFYGVRPRTVSDQRERIAAALAEARARSVSILVLPELSLTAELFESLSAEGAFAGLDLVVAGSFHTPVPAATPGENVAVVMADGEEVHRHRKFSDFHYEDRAKQRRHEHLARDPDKDGFSVLVGPGCAAIVLVCKDILDERIKTLVQQLSPTLVLVPAMSPRVDDFVLFSERMARDPQAFTVVACTGSPAGAVFCRPVQANPRQVVTRPSLVVWSVDGTVQSFKITKDFSD